MRGFSLLDVATHVYDIDLNQTDPVQLADRLRRVSPNQRLQLRINCQCLQCLRTHGVSYLVSQLLLTRRAGADIVLYNVNLVLGRALRLLQLHQVFRVLPAAAPA